MALPPPFLERAGCLYLRRSEPPRPWLALLLLLPVALLGWMITGGGFSLRSNELLFMAPCLVAVGFLLLASRAPLRYWTQLDPRAQKLRLPPRLGGKEIPFERIRGVAAVRGIRSSVRGPGIDLPWYGARLTLEGGQLVFVFDCDDEAVVLSVAEKVGLFLGLQVQRERTSDEIPR